ncbi:unnamed protein product [Nippostrongylus brasiliensis]|uniref:MARVEL domain-containing protein n=1 Tax=Nippostrongylus brasiliensis TaxID=27835 RepID=A0A0N4XDE3_NIPBR|nr:unnamed protein product [Nippostrongylus brasiliensis]
MKPTVTVTPPKTASDSLYHSKITALLLVLLDVTVIAVIVTHGGIAVTEMPLWTLCLLLWGIALVLVLIGIWTSKTKFFIPAYVVWIATFISSILFIIVDAYVSTFCENSAKNKTGRWNSPCDAFLQRKGMIVFEKIAGAFKGDRPKINDMGKSSIA